MQLFSQKAGWLGIFALLVATQAGVLGQTTAIHRSVSVYTAVATLSVTNTFTFTNALWSLLWRPQLPVGWTLGGVSGDGNPELSGGEILWAGKMPSSPIRMVYTVQVPVGAVGAQKIGGEVEYQFAGMVNPATVFADPNPMTLAGLGDPPATHLSSAQYVAGSTLSVTNTFTFTNALWSLLWRPQLPVGWALGAVSGDGNPELSGGEIVWTGKMPSSPIRMVYTVQAPIGAAGDKQIGGEVEYQFAGMVNPAIVFADPNPLTLAAQGSLGTVQATHHSSAQYVVGSTLSVTNTFTFTNALWSLLWRPQLPIGWTLGAVSGDGNPELSGGEILWTGKMPSSPIRMVYTVQVPVGAVGAKQIGGELEYQFAGMVNPATVFANPNPLMVVNLSGIVGTKRWEFYDLWLGGQSSPAIGTDGTVYVAGNGMVYGLDGATGTPRWRRDTGVGIRSSPAVGANDTVYIGLGNERVYAMDGATGNQLWEFLTGGIVESSPAIGGDGTVYIGSQNKRVFALDGATGAKRWEFIDTDQNAREIDSSPAIGADGTIYFGTRSGLLYAVNAATGAKRWEFYCGSQVASSPAIGADGTIYFGSTFDFKVYALNGATGAKRWEFTTGGYVVSSPALGTDGTVYIGSDDKKIYALDRFTGVKRWAFATEGKIRAAPAVGADGVVYVGSFDKKLYALDGATGAKLWEFDTGGEVESSPVIGPDGTLYFVANGGRVYAFWTSSTGGLANSPWPMFHQNARHTGRAGTTSPMAPSITVHPQNQTVAVGANVDFFVTVTGTEPLAYQWRKNGTNLVDDERISGTRTNLLTIGGTQPGDGGSYDVVVSNVVTRVISQSAILTLLNMAPVLTGKKLADGFRLEWLSEIGLSYQVQCSTNLGAWEAIGTSFSGTGNVLVYEYHWLSGKQDRTMFFRLRISEGGFLPHNQSGYGSLLQNISRVILDSGH